MKLDMRTLFCGLALLATPALARAELLRIIHTNDLHSQLEHAADPARGGYAAVKGLIDRIRNEATAQGIDSLVLDAGDFSEGSQFYLADEGRESWRVMDAMGFDAVTLGNHDWLLGPPALDRLLGAVRPSFPLLGANFHHAPQHRNIARYVRPHVEMRKAGVRIAILGLTTDEFVYNWRADGFVTSPGFAAKEWLPELRQRNDYVIALTHLGLPADQALARGVDGIDLIVGGHSHTTLPSPVRERNRRGRETPIVQAGEHGEYVGSILVDVTPGKPLQILSYSLEPVQTEGPRDGHIELLVQETRRRLETEYGADWLYSPIGQAEVPLDRQLVSGVGTPWSALLTDALRDAGSADVSLDIPEFNGIPQPPGPINRERLFALYPRVFGFSGNPGGSLGWTVWTTRLHGWILKLVLVEALKRKVVFSVSGVSYDLVRENGKRKVRNVRIGGRKVRILKSYKLALPEGIGRAVVEISDLLSLVLRKNTDTRIPVWTAVENRLRAQGGVVR